MAKLAPQPYPVGVRVAYVSTIERGGPATHLRTLAPSVSDLGVDVVVVCGSRSVADLFRGTGIDVRLAPVKSKWDVAGARRMAAMLQGADVVHAHDRRAALFALPAARLGRAATLYTYHGLPEDFAPIVGRPEDPAGAIIPWWRRLWVLHGLLAFEGLLGRLGGVVVPSRALADFLVGHGFPSRCLAVVPYGIDVREPVHRDPADRFRVGTAAILIPRKNVALTLEACARASTPLRLDVYGDGPCRPSLEARARQLGVDATFHGLVSDVRDRLPGLDLFVLSTNGDNLPVAILEAMAAGLPVVATRTGGIPELVVDGVTGFLVEPGDVGGIAAAIEVLAADDVLRRAMGKASRERAVARFEAGQVARTMVDLYEALCASSM